MILFVCSQGLIHARTSVVNYPEIPDSFLAQVGQSMLVIAEAVRGRCS